jgi:hypothetical protein
VGNHIDRLDEILLDPPYQLGTGAAPYESHAFFLAANREALVRITNTYLNDPLGPNAPVEFVVPPTPNLCVVFNRYGRAESLPQPDSGWLAYSEVFVCYLLLRKRRDAFFSVPTATWHLPLIYIDGLPASGGTGPQPSAVPVHLRPGVLRVSQEPGGDPLRAVGQRPGRGGAPGLRLPARSERPPAAAPNRDPHHPQGDPPGTPGAPGARRRLRRAPLSRSPARGRPRSAFCGRTALRFG